MSVIQFLINGLWTRVKEYKSMNSLLIPLFNPWWMALILQGMESASFTRAAVVRVRNSLLRKIGMRLGDDVPLRPVERRQRRLHENATCSTSACWRCNGKGRPRRIWGSLYFGTGNLATGGQGYKGSKLGIDRELMDLCLLTPVQRPFIKNIIEMT